jgi:hypothetical protein
VRRQSSDPTGGVLARRIQMNPGVPQRNMDPTDPRYGVRGSAGAPQPNFDPTDTEYGTPSR